MNHHYYMQKALDLAVKGRLHVAPNPMVGAVIVKNGTVVAEGYHRRFGEAHAEVNAINNLAPDVKPADCTIYVTLEPCSHHGKTPPCADLLISRGFGEVVIACKDPNPLVAGLGIQKLRDAGIRVITGILEHEARQLNKRFICFYEQRRPYVTLKWAVTADGFMSRLPVPERREDNLITGPEAGRFVHGLRAASMAILVGSSTVLHDDPLLTTRLVAGRNPLRVMVDSGLKVPRQARIYNQEAATLVLNTLREGREGNLEFVKIDPREALPVQVLQALYQRNMHSVLVEGGSRLLGSFIDAGLWDEAFVLQNPDLKFGTGLRGPDFGLGGGFEMLGSDRIFSFTRQKRAEPA